MSFITEWVTQIIIFILLAVIIDLLIPSSKMKKYIKFVVGLILLLIFLRPIFTVFNMDLASELERTMTQALQMDDSNLSIENSTKLQKSEIQALQDAYILKELKEQLIQIAHEPLKEHHEVEIVDIEFSFFNGQTVSYDALEVITVTIQQMDHLEGQVKVIEEIVIFDQDQSQDDEEMTHQTEEIKQLLISIWEVHDKDIIIKWQ